MPRFRTMIGGIVLAAGRSRRMGRPKALLELNGETFLSRAISALAGGGCSRVVVVNGPLEVSGSREIGRLSRAARALVLVNPANESEQIASLRLALAEMADAEAVVVTPVDVPLIAPAVVRTLVREFRRTGPPLVVPTYNGLRGHPVLFSRDLFPDLLQADLSEGARSVVHASERDLVEVEVPDPGVLVDVDTQEQYRRLLGGEP